MDKNNFIVGANMNIKRISLYPSVASIISLSLLMSPQVNAAAENAGEFYLGAKTGWANFDYCESGDDCDDDAWGGSVYGGYQFNEWFSLEGGYNYLGKAKASNSTQGYLESKVQNGELGAKFDWNLTSAWNLFGKVGTSYNDIEHDLSQGSNISDNNWSVMLGAGVEYQLSHNWRIRTEYQWFDDVGSSSVAKSDVNYLSLGLSYYFGSSESAAPVAAATTTAAVVAAQEPEPEPVVAEEPLPAATLSGHAFEHDSTELTEEAKTTLAPVAEYLNQRPEIKVDVIGYTDSTGSAKYNQKLSEQRAQAASDYLESKGVDESRVTTIGKGEENPIADNSTVEGREKNRRIEVSYK